MRRPGRRLPWIVAVIAIAGGTGAPLAQSQGGRVQQSYQRDPFADAAADAAAPGRLQAAVKLVKLDSCDPAVLSKGQVGPVDMKDAAARGQRLAEVDRYHAALAAYASGDVSGGIGQVISLGDERLTRVLGSINKRGVDRNAPWEGRSYALAVMLHTDAALHLAGDTYGKEMYAQLQVAADLLQLGVRCAPDRIRPLAARWYVSLSRLFRDRTALHAAEALLELGRKRLPEDASVLCESGLLAESIATIYALLPTSTPWTWTGGDARLLGQITGRRRAWLDDAVARYARAAELEPGSDESLLHLGRSRALRFEDDAALRCFRTVLERTSSDEHAYLAAIFAAAVHDRRGHLEDAAASYRAAIARLPDGHAGRIGLADTLSRSGRADDARHLLRTLTDGRAGSVEEPFWWYVLDPPGAADARVAALREEARR